MELIRQLSEAPGVSGDEGAVRAILRSYLEGHVDALEVDTAGNLIATKGNGPLKVMLDAHTDEVGLIVSKIDDDGYLEFKKVGGIDDRVLAARHVRVGAAGVPGVIGLKAIHLSDRADEEKPAQGLVIDIGACNRAEAAEHVKLGDRVVFATDFEQLSDEVLKGKAFDDRIGCRIVAELMRRVEPVGYTLYGVFSVQEEVGLRGARVAAHRLAPDLGLGFEGTVCADLPGVPAHGQTTKLGGGPALTIADGTLIPDQGLLKRLLSLASEHGLKVQLRQTMGGGTNGGAVHITRAGVPWANLSVPCRYLHTQASLMHVADYRGALRLAELFLGQLEGGGWHA